MTAETAISGEIREKAIEDLAKYLHWKQWHLDPEPGQEAPPDWEALPEFDQNFYRSTIEALMSNTLLIRIAVSRE